MVSEQQKSRIKEQSAENNGIQQPETPWQLLYLILKDVIINWHPLYSLILIVLAIIGYIFISETKILQNTEPINREEAISCDLIEYGRIEDSMTPTQVMAIMNSTGIEIKRKGNISVQMWEKNGVKIIIKFEDGKLTEIDRDGACYASTVYGL